MLQAAPDMEQCCEAPASLVPDETRRDAPLTAPSTSIVPPLADSSVLAFRHSGWARDRERIWKALHAVGAPTARLERFRDCGSNAFVLTTREEHPRFRVGSNTCRDRFCLACQGDRSRRLLANLKAKLPDAQLRFITLTIRSRDEPLTQQLDFLWHSFTRLRQQRYWSSKVAGGVAFCEVTYSADRRQWHPHLHVIVTGKYLAQDVLVRCWSAATNGSFIVDIRQINQEHDAASYVAKYLTKSLGATVIRNPDVLAEALIAFHGRKMFATFGSFRSLRLLDSPEPGDWYTLCTLEELICQAKQKNAFAQQVLDTLARRQVQEEDRPPQTAIGAGFL